MTVEDLRLILGLHKIDGFLRNIKVSETTDKN
jgi:hypothetical protein